MAVRGASWLRRAAALAGCLALASLPRPKRVEGAGGVIDFDQGVSVGQVLMQATAPAPPIPAAQGAGGATYGVAWREAYFKAWSCKVLSLLEQIESAAPVRCGFPLGCFNLSPYDAGKIKAAIATNKAALCELSRAGVPSFALRMLFESARLESWQSYGTLYFPDGGDIPKWAEQFGDLIAGASRCRHALGEHSLPTQLLPEACQSDEEFWKPLAAKPDIRDFARRVEEVVAAPAPTSPASEGNASARRRFKVWDAAAKGSQTR